MKAMTKIFVLSGILGAMVGLGVYVLHPHEPKDGPVRVAFPYDRSPQSYDPARITLGPEYIFLENVFSPLIEMDIHGTVTSGVASRFEWQEDEAVLTLRKDLFTVDGHQIDVHDAEISLKRLLVLTGNTHGNLLDLLCGGKKLVSINDHCPGIEVRGDQLILKPGHRRPFLFPMLAAIDFAVIPRQSIDQNSLGITDFRNTTGPYYVADDAGRGHITLKANPKHYHYSDRMPQEIKLVPMNSEDPNRSLKALDRGEVDVVTTIDAATPEAVLQFHRKNGDRFTLHKTQNIRNILLQYSERGRQVLSQEQRRGLGKAVRAAFSKLMSKSLAYKSEIQFLPVFGNGGLSEKQIADLEKLFAESAVPKVDGSGKKAVVVRLALRDEFKTIFDEIMPGLDLNDGQSFSFLTYKNPEDMPILEISGPDTGFLEDIGLISYSMNAGMLFVPKDQRQNWLAEYGVLERKEDRIAKLNQVHFKALMDPVIVPLAAAPYVALATNDWNIGLSTLFANNQLWLFTRK